ncbi:30S ribosomal protein S6 [Candidatus Dojkabacteria bacterium]|uniref:Small ribosomal subunit protein bS6 n=1 Tax=Candidatus Dojkabacteria bacterium TaxID=2099670 RepID=A0A955L5D7_9BACT|nr:30S ribosomal protein S6 [Candidatus Dojkabacteria bacterium]
MDYEMMVILKPLLPEDIRAGVLKRINTLVKEHKGSIKSEDVWGKRHLAYPIKNHEEGYYIVYNLELESDQVQDLQRELKLISDILRFLLIKQEK